MGIKVKNIKIDINHDKLREVVDNAIKQKTFDVICPFCNNKINVPTGKSLCPSCNREIDLTVTRKN